MRRWRIKIVMGSSMAAEDFHHTTFRKSACTHFLAEGRLKRYPDLDIWRSEKTCTCIYVHTSCRTTSNHTTLNRPTWSQSMLCTITVQVRTHARGTHVVFAPHITYMWDYVKIDLHIIYVVSIRALHGLEASWTPYLHHIHSRRLIPLVNLCSWWAVIAYTLCAHRQLTIFDALHEYGMGVISLSLTFYRQRCEFSCNCLKMELGVQYPCWSKCCITYWHCWHTYIW